MLRIITGAVIGGIVLFAWSFLSWMLLPWHTTTMRTLPMEASIRQSLATTVSEPGLYWLPNMPHDEDLDAEAATAAMEAWRAKYVEGPSGYMVILPDGADPFDGRRYGQGLAIDVIGAMFAGVLLAMAGLKGYGHRVLFMVLIGLMIGVMADLINWNWMHHPMDYTLVMMGDRLISFLLAGLIMAAIIKPRSGMR